MHPDLHPTNYNYKPVPLSFRHNAQHYHSQQVKPRASTKNISRTASAPLPLQNKKKTVKTRGSKSLGASPATKKSAKKQAIPIPTSDSDTDTDNYVHKKSKRQH